MGPFCSRCDSNSAHGSAAPPALRPIRKTLPRKDLPVVRPLRPLHRQERGPAGALPRLRAFLHTDGPLERHLLHRVRADEKAELCLI